MLENDRTSVFAHTSLSVLVVEDDPDYAELLADYLTNQPEVEITLAKAGTLEAARTKFAAGPFDAVLLDVRLPDSSGLRTVREMLAVAQDAAVVVLTAVGDRDLAQRSIEMGAEEFLLKEWVEPFVLVRALRYAVDRHRLTKQLQEARERESRERELRRLERMTETATTTHTAAQYASSKLQTREPKRFADLAEEYGRMLDEALEQRAYRSGGSPKDDLRSLASVLGWLAATPRDVVELHTEVLRSRISVAKLERAQAYVEEARVLVLELMGYLATYYRARSIGAPSHLTRSAETSGESS